VVRSFILACIATAVLAVAGWYALDRLQQPVDVAFATTGVRL